MAGLRRVLHPRKLFRAPHQEREAGIGFSMFQAFPALRLVVLGEPVFDRVPDTVGLEILRPQVHVCSGEPETVLDLRPEEMLKLSGKRAVPGIARDAVDDGKRGQRAP